MAASAKVSVKEKLLDLTTSETQAEQRNYKSLTERGVTNTNMIWNNLNFNVNINENNNEVPELNIKKEPFEVSNEEIKTEKGLKIEDCVNNNSLQHYGVRSLLFSCSECDFKVERLLSLLSHMSVHAAASLFSCPICSYKSSLPKMLDIHLRFHKGDTLYACPKCEYLCRNRCSLRKHITCHSDLDLPFQCLKFEFMLNKNTHRQLHSLLPNGSVLIHKDDSLDYLSDCDDIDEYDDNVIIKEEDLIDIADLDTNSYSIRYNIKSEFGEVQSDFSQNNSYQGHMNNGKPSHPIKNYNNNNKNSSLEIKSEPFDSKKEKRDSFPDLGIVNSDKNLFKSEIKTEKSHSEGVSKLKMILESKMNKQKTIYNSINIQQPNLLSPNLVKVSDSHSMGPHIVKVSDSQSRLSQPIQLQPNVVSPYKQHFFVPSGNVEPLVINQSLANPLNIHIDQRKPTQVLENQVNSNIINCMQENLIQIHEPNQNVISPAGFSSNLQNLNYYKMSHTGERILQIPEHQLKHQHLAPRQRKLAIKQKQQFLLNKNQRSQQVQNMIQHQNHYNQPSVSQNHLIQNHQQELYQPQIIIHPQMTNHVQHMSYHESNNLQK
ncbi:unnamed protein product, partial [Meganyctiphanes norvegica]